MKTPPSVLRSVLLHSARSAREKESNEVSYQNLHKEYNPRAEAVEEEEGNLPKASPLSVSWLYVSGYSSGKSPAAPAWVMAIETVSSVSSHRENIILDVSMRTQVTVAIDIAVAASYMTRSNVCCNQWPVVTLASDYFVC